MLVKTGMRQVVEVDGQWSVSLGLGQAAAHGGRAAPHVLSRQGCPWMPWRGRNPAEGRWVYIRRPMPEGAGGIARIVRILNVNFVRICREQHDTGDNAHLLQSC